MIRDQLSPDLDWNTFRPGSSSHAYEASLHDDGLVEFHFRNIQLQEAIPALNKTPCMFTMLSTYNVCLTVSNIWGTTQTCEDITIMVTGIDTPDAASTLRLQPNPTSSIVWIESSADHAQEEVVLYNATGKALRRITLQQKTTRWDLSDLPAGTYWMRSERGEVVPLVVVR